MIAMISGLLVQSTITIAILEARIIEQTMIQQSALREILPPTPSPSHTDQKEQQQCKASSLLVQRMALFHEMPTIAWAADHHPLGPP